MTIDGIAHATKTVSFSANLPASLSSGDYVGRLVFAGTVEANPDREMGYTGKFEKDITAADRTPTFNRKNVVDTFQNMYIREILGRIVYEYCANDSEEVLETFEAARTH